MPSSALRVVVDARVRPGGHSGGLAGLVAALAGGLAELDGPEEYLLLVSDGGERLKPYLNGNIGLLETSQPLPMRPPPASGAPVRPADWIPPPPASDGIVERAEADVVHQIRQAAFITSLPTIYHPHDLQHVHHPEFFTPAEVRRREEWYGAFCRQAAMVAVASTWVRADVMRHFSLRSDVVKVVPLAGFVATADPVNNGLLPPVAARYGLPAAFVLYPAQTWPHKNHGRLLEALALLKASGLRIPLVCCGHLNDHFPALRDQVRALRLEEDVSWLGYLEARELRALYGLARAVVIPTLFEAASAPVWEAFDADVPVACSNVTSLPEQAGNAAVLFDPMDVRAMAEAIARVWSDEELRRTLRRQGRQRMAGRSWQNTALTFRAHYRRLARRPLSDTDRQLLALSAAI